QRRARERAHRRAPDRIGRSGRSRWFRLPGGSPWVHQPHSSNLQASPGARAPVALLSEWMPWVREPEALTGDGRAPSREVAFAMGRSAIARRARCATTSRGGTGIPRIEGEEVRELGHVDRLIGTAGGSAGRRPARELVPGEGPSERPETVSPRVPIARGG